MTLRIEVYAGTAGHSAWFSQDLGLTWVHPNSHSGMYLEARVWTISTHPSDLNLLYAGTDMGLYRWDERTTRWTFIASPMTDIWALAQDPDNSNIIYAGTRPAGFFRSSDAGANWEKLDAPGIQQFSDINMGPTRVTQILFDPRDHNTLWACVEIGGIYRSTDRGQHWTLQTEGLVSTDVHGIAIVHNKLKEKSFLQPRTVACTAARITVRPGFLRRWTRPGNIPAASRLAVMMIRLFSLPMAMARPAIQAGYCAAKIMERPGKKCSFPVN
jgi:hypothetical protein